MIPIRSQAELDLMREAGVIAGRVIGKLREALRPQMTTAELDALAEELISKENAQPAFKGYKGFPACTCISLNEEIVHGIPDGRKILSGDIVSIDLGVLFKGFFSDTAITVAVGKIDPKVQKLIEVTREALAEGIKKAKAGNRLSDISYAIQHYVERNGFSVVRQFVGHGIGRALHEEPEIPNFGLPGNGALLKEGMALAIEPMVNLGGWECEILENGWTAVTKDRLPSAHFEHTVVITENGTEILTS